MRSSSPHRRNGKVARLPHATRQIINQMLDDGLLYKDIITRLGDTGHGLTVHNISNWRMGGCQDHLNAQRAETVTRIRTEAAVGLAKSRSLPEAGQIGRAINQLSLLQQLELIAEKGGEYAAEAFRQNPAKFITLINACTKLSNAEVAGTVETTGTGSRPPRRNQNCRIEPNRTQSNLEKISFKAKFRSTRSK